MALALEAERDWCSEVRIVGVWLESGPSSCPDEDVRIDGVVAKKSKVIVKVGYTTLTIMWTAKSLRHA